MAEQNEQIDKKQATSFRETLHVLLQRLHELARHEQDIMQRIDILDRTASELGDRELEIALRRSFTKMVDCGRLLTQIHLDLTVPATVIQGTEHKGE